MSARTAVNQEPRRDLRAGVGLAGGLLLLAGPPLAVPGCHDDPPGIRVDFTPAAQHYRPEYVRFHWLRPGRRPFEDRLPEVGNFEGEGDVLGSLFVETVGPLSEPRGLAVRGFRDDREISGGLLTIPASTVAQQHLLLTLKDRLPDVDQNGIPDVADKPCFDGEILRACADPMPPDASTPVDGGVEPDAGAGGDATDAPDATGPIEEGLVGWWRFDDGAGSTMAADTSGNRNHGALRGTGLTWTVGRPGSGGGALDIPNQPDHGVVVNASPSLDGLRAFTLSLFVYRTCVRGGLASLIARRSTGIYEHFALALSADGHPRLYLNTHEPVEGQPVIAPEAVPLETWTHLAATYDGSIARVFVGGVETQQSELAVHLRGSETALCLGCGQNQDVVVTEPACGRIDDVRIYDRALSAAAVAALAR